LVWLVGWIVLVAAYAVWATVKRSASGGEIQEHVKAESGEHPLTLPASMHGRCSTLIENLSRHSAVATKVADFIIEAIITEWIERIFLSFGRSGA